MAKNKIKSTKSETRTAGSTTDFSRRLKKLGNAFNEAKTKAPTGPVTLPTGRYPAKFVKATLGENNGGLLQFSMQYEINGGDHEGQKVTRRFVLEGEYGQKNMEYMLGDLSKFGYDIDQITIADLPDVEKDMNKTKKGATVQLFIKETENGFNNTYLNRVLAEGEGEAEEAEAAPEEEEEAEESEDEDESDDDEDEDEDEDGEEESEDDEEESEDGDEDESEDDEDEDEDSEESEDEDEDESEDEDEDEDEEEAPTWKVGDRVQAPFDIKGKVTMFPGKVTKISSKTGKVTVTFDDGDVMPFDAADLEAVKKAKAGKPAKEEAKEEEAEESDAELEVGSEIEFKDGKKKQSGVVKKIMDDSVKVLPEGGDKQIVIPIAKITAILK